jgi:hypothetical protein
LEAFSSCWPYTGLSVEFMSLTSAASGHERQFRFGLRLAF